SDTYRVQVHTYGYGARLRGEEIEHVAIVGWPREAGSIKGLHVWTEPYDESIAIEALARVDRIAEEVQEHAEAFAPLAIAAVFPTADDCRFCPFATKTNQGCKGHG